MPKSAKAARAALEATLTGALTLALHDAEPAFGDPMSAHEIAYPGYQRPAARKWKIEDGKASVRAVLDETVRFPDNRSANAPTATHWSVGVGEDRRYSGRFDEPIVIVRHSRPEFALGAIEITES